MIPEVGHVALILALPLALAQGAFALPGGGLLARTVARHRAKSAQSPVSPGEPS